MRPTAPDAFAVPPDEHRVVTDRFIAACANGNFDGLLAVLDPDVTGGVDLRPGVVVHGARAVARNLVHYWGRGASLVSLPFVENPCVLAFADRDVAALFSLTVAATAVAKIHVYAEPRATGVHPGPGPAGRGDGVAPQRSVAVRLAVTSGTAISS